MVDSLVDGAVTVTVTGAEGYRPPTAGASLDVLCLGWAVAAT